MFTSQQLPSIIEMIRNQGRNGDTMLAHINPEEAQMLQEMGGSGTINPNTGLPEYFGLGSLFGLLPSMTKSSPKSSSRILGGLLANPDVMKKAIESGVFGVIPNQLKPGLFKKLEDNGTMPKSKPHDSTLNTQPQNPKPDMKELAQKLKENNIFPFKKRNRTSDDDSGGIFGGMFDALPAIAKNNLGEMGSMATGALAPSMKSNIGNIIKKMNPKDLQKASYAMSGRWEE